MPDRYFEVEVVSIKPKKKLVTLKFKDDKGHSLEQDLIVGGSTRITIKDKEIN